MDNSFIVLPTYDINQLKKFVFKNTIDKNNLENLIRIFLVNKSYFNFSLDKIETYIFTRDNLHSIIKSIKLKYNEFDCHLQLPVLFNLFNSITFNKTLFLLLYYLNYFDYTIIKFKNQKTNYGIRTCYKVISIEKIKKYYNFEYNYFENKEYNFPYKPNMVFIKHRRFFNTSRHNHIYIDFK